MTASRAFRAAVLCFLGGTAVGLFFSWSLGMALVLCAMAIAVAFIWLPKRLPLATVCVVSLLAVFCGAWLRAARTMTVWDTLPAISTTLDRAIVGQVESKESSKQAILRPVSCGAVSCPTVLVLGLFPAFADIAEGDILSLSCRLEKPEQFTSDFDYPRVLAKDGIGYVCRFPKSWKREGVSGGMLLASVRAVRTGVERSIERAIPEPEAGLVLGLLVGGNGRLPKNIQDEFSRTGLSHIVAVSGYNVSIVAVLLMNLLIFCGLYRQQALWGALLGVAFFTVVVGAPASAVRAALMTSVALGAVRMERLGNPINAIFLAASAMLLANPLLLRYDIGFQLSFAATVGIFLVTPFALLSLRAGDIVATTVAAELFVLPIILFHFHALPALSLPANALVLPLVPLAMFFGSVAALGSALFPSLAVVLGFPAFLAVHAILSIIGFFASKSFASIPLQSFGVVMVALWYGALFFALVFLRRKFPAVLPSV